tara:strand:+ start:3695 stop:3919 length:225 start_codon:yes stop_codon:yes gene_type:complete
LTNKLLLFINLGAILLLSKEGKMDIFIGDVVKDNCGALGIVKLVDGVAVWVQWIGQSKIDFSSCFNLSVVASAY